MKKQILFLMSVLFIALSTNAKPLERGYRGFLDFNNELVVSEYKPYLLTGISTSHGFQFNEHYFLGGGLWLQNTIAQGYYRPAWAPFSFPIFIQGRTDWTFGKYPLYADLRVGATILGGKIGGDDDKLFIHPSFGYRLDWGRRVCMNFAIGVSMHGCDKGWNKFVWRPTPSLRIGIEF